MRARLGAVTRQLPPVMDVVRWSRTRAPFSVIDRRVSRLRSSPHLRVSDAPDPELMADLVERIGTDGRIRHVRDVTYLSWRYRNPAASYRFLYWGRNPLRGYLVLRSASRTAPTSIVDWEAVDPEVAGALVDVAVVAGGLPNLRIWGTSLSPTALEILKNAGFGEPVVNQASRYADRIIVRSLGDGAPENTFEIGSRRFDRISDWDLRMVYSSAF